jgi:hypothetical protein
MSDDGLTNDERRCLQLWFRQAIAKLEQEEVTNELVRRHGLPESSSTHRAQTRRRPARRNRLPIHGKEVLV